SPSAARNCSSSAVQAAQEGQSLLPSTRTLTGASLSSRQLPPSTASSRPASPNEGVPLLPVGAAEAAAPERLDGPQHLVRAPPDAQVVQRGRSDDALVVDDDGRAIRDALVLLEDAEGAAHGVVRVGDDRVRDRIRERRAIREPSLV